MSADFEIKNAACLVTPQLSGQMCILGRNWSFKIPRLAQTLHNMAKTVKEMSDSIREWVHEFPNVLRTNVNCRETKLSVSQSSKSPICGEIIFSVQLNPLHATELNLDSMIALLDINESNESIEPPEITKVRAQHEKELESCSAKTLFDLTPEKNLYAFEIEFLDPLQSQ